jgi:hypothetical protein
MSHGRPSVEALLAALRMHLEDNVQPQLSGALAYQNRVAIGLVRTLERDRAATAAAEQDERASLARLLGMQGTLDALNAELCRRIRARQLGSDDASLLEHLDRVALAAVAIDNPSYSALQRRSSPQG